MSTPDPAALEADIARYRTTINQALAACLSYDMRQAISILKTADGDGDEGER